MMDSAWLAAIFGLVGAICAAIWSFLMAKYVAGPRAKDLMVGVLKGETEKDKVILSGIRENLIRPELKSIVIPEMPEMPEFEMPELTIPDAQIDALASRMYAMFQGERGNMTKDLQRELMKFGAPIDDIAEAMMDGARAAQNPGDVALMKLLNVEISPQFKKKFPQLDFLIKSGQVTVAQLYDMARQTGLMNQGNGAEVAPRSSGSIGVR